MWSRAEERVHFSGEREIQEEKLREAEEHMAEERLKRGGVLVFILGLLGTSQWLS